VETVTAMGESGLLRTLPLHGTYEGSASPGEIYDSCSMPHELPERNLLNIEGLEMIGCHILVRFSRWHINAICAPQWQTALLSRLEKLLMKRYRGTEVFAIYDEDMEENLAFHIYLNEYECDSPTLENVLRHDLGICLPTLITEALPAEDQG
jgi:hypothetical protein